MSIVGGTPPTNHDLGPEAAAQGWVPAAHGSDVSELRGQVARGIPWTFAQQWVGQLVSLVTFVVIARQVVPEALGVVALAGVFVSFALIFVDAGMAAALIQRRELTRAHIDTAFWTSLGVGAVLSGLGIALAVPLGTLLGEPRVVPVLQVLSLTFVLYGLTNVQSSLLTRELAFRRLALRGLLSTIGGSVVGITLAYLGAGAWALVGQQLTAAALAVVTLWGISPWRPGREVGRVEFVQLFGFGINVVGGNLLEMISRRTDNLLVGIYLGATQLGLYAVAYQILDAVQTLLSGLATRAAFPAFSRLQGDPVRQRSAFLKLTRLTGALAIPGFLALALTAPELITLVFGQRWADSGPTAAALFMVGAAYSLSIFSAAAFQAAGHPEVAFRFRVANTLANVVGFYVAAVVFGTILAVAAAYALRAYLLLPLNLYWLRRYVGVPVGQLLLGLRGTALASGAMAIVVVLIKSATPPAAGPALLVALEAAIGACAFAIALWLTDRRLLTEVLDLLHVVFPRAAAERVRPTRRPGRRR